MNETTCLHCGRPTDAPLCVDCEARARATEDDLVLDTLDILYADVRRTESHRAQRRYR